MGDEQDKQMASIGAAMPKAMGGTVRWACALFGVAVIAAGVAAVFIATSEVGSIGLLFLGALFLVIGIAGATPLKLKIGDNEVDFAQMQAMQDITRGVVDTPVPKDRIANTRDVLALSEVAPRLATPALASIAFRTQVLQIARKYAFNHPLIVIATPEDNPTVQYDAVLSENPGTRSVAVQVNLCRTLAHRGLVELTGRADDYSSKTEHNGTLLVVTENKLPTRFSLWARRKRVQIIVMRGADGEALFEEALTKALGLKPLA